MTTTMADVDIQKAFRGLKTSNIRTLEERTGKQFNVLLEEAQSMTGDGLVMVAIAAEQERDPAASFDDLWERAGDWSLSDYEDLADSIEDDDDPPLPATGGSSS